jgi:hypothetical protein
MPLFEIKKMWIGRKITTHFSFHIFILFPQSSMRKQAISNKERVVKECVFARLKIFYKGDHVK